MGLSDVIARTAARHAHALVVEAPGSWRTRVMVERAVLARGWRLAVSPADADVLVVCGESGPRLADALGLVWHQMPGPRVRVDVRRYDEVAARLDDAQARLLDTAHHRDDAQHRPAAHDLLDEQDGDDDEDHGDHDGGHEGMDHGDMEMSPGGIPLAEGGADRDGLEMDILNVRLGPVLPHWPAGLVLRCSLQGDVIASAQAELLDGSGRCEQDPEAPGRRVDDIVSVLALAGWDAAAAEARAIRDSVLDHGLDDETRARLGRLARRMSRSRILRWSLRGLRPLTEQDLAQHGLPADAVGDAYDRAMGMLDRAVAGDAGAVLSTDHLGHLVKGLDLATARLVIASLGMQELRAGHAEHEVAHG
ncbi:MAG: hypothetical protein ACLGH4_06995 [Actinomycetes bacterium]